MMRNIFEKPCDLLVKMFFVVFSSIFILSAIASKAPDLKAISLKNKVPVNFKINPSDVIKIVFTGKREYNEYLLCTIGSNVNDVELKLQNPQSKSVKLEMVYEKNYKGGEPAFYRILPNLPNNMIWKTENIKENDIFVSISNLNNKHPIFGFCGLIPSIDMNSLPDNINIKYFEAMNSLAKSINMPVSVDFN